MATWCCSATPLTPRISRSAREPRWRWRMRSPWPGPSARRTGISPRRSPTMWRSGCPSSKALSEPRRPASSGSRTSIATSANHRGNSPSTCLPAAAESPMTICDCATPSSSIRSTSSFSAKRRKCGRRCSPDPVARARAPQSHRRVAHGYVFGGRRHGADFHMVHLGARGIGGAGLLMTEMICVSAEGRITPGCAGMYTRGPRRGMETNRRVPSMGMARRESEPRSATVVARGPRNFFGMGPMGRSRRAGGRCRPSAVPYFEHSRVPQGNGPRRYGPGSRRFRRRDRSLCGGRTSTCWRSISRTAICSRRSSRR